MRFLRRVWTELPVGRSRAALALALAAAAAGAARALERARRVARLRRLRERRRARRARLRRTLHERSTLARRLELDLTEGLVEVDASGRIAFVNAAAIEMLGIDRASVLGRRVDEVLRRGPPEACPLHAPLHEGRPAHGEDQVFARADGTLLPVSYTASPVVRSGRVVGALLTFSRTCSATRSRWCHRAGRSVSR